MDFKGLTDTSESSFCGHLHDKQINNRNQKKPVDPTINGLIFLGGGERIRTDDPLLAKQVLYQLSYTPDEKGPQSKVFIGYSEP